jgi:predicted esterase
MRGARSNDRGQRACWGGWIASSSSLKRLSTVVMITAAAIATAAVAGDPAAIAHGRRVPRPDLVVSEGSVAAAGGQLSGSFVVRNIGAQRAGRSWATLTISVPHGDRPAGRFRVGPIAPSSASTIEVSVKVPAGLPTGTFRVRACADSSGSVHESSETNNCRRVGKIGVSPPSSSTPPRSSSVPADPIPFQTDDVFTLQDPQSNYWIFVPDAYDASGRTPIELFVWLHGCGGEAAGDIYTISPGGDQRYISVAVGGREDDCWDPNVDQDKVLAAITNVESHFNVDPRRVVLGGYSSGGDLAYRLAFYHSNDFAGLLAENTSPFRDTGSSAAASLAAATWKFNVVHLAHTEDNVYPIDGVRREVGEMTSAGFPIQLIERPGDHYDDSTADSGTDHDLQTLLLPHLNDGWRSP